MQKNNRNQYQPYPQNNLSTRLLKHQQQMLQFLYFTQYDIVLQTFQLKHASYLSSSKRGYPVQDFSKSQQIQRHFHIISQKLHIRLMREDIDLDKRLEKLQLLWHSRSVPFFHRYYFEKYVYSAFVKNVQSLIDTEQKLIRQEKHAFYTILRTISARQACLRQLKKHLAELNDEDVFEYLHIAKQRFFNQKKKTQHEKLLKKGYKVKVNNQTDPIVQAKISKCKLQFFSDNFNHLTKLTLYCIDQIFKWKEYIYSLTHDVKKRRQRVQYVYFEENYFLKILSDTSFIKVSFLQRFFKFAPKNDPFMLWPILAFEKNQTKQLDSQLLKLIFVPQQEQLAQIMNKIEALSEQYKWNIRSRKNYDINVLRKPLQIQQEKKKMDQQRQQPASNLILKKLVTSPPKKSQSMKMFRIREQTKQKQAIKSSNKDKILIEFKSSPKKRINWLPGLTPKTLLETQVSPLKNSVILQKNKANPLTSNIVSDDLLKSLKQEVVRKIKLDFAANIPANKTSKDAALEMYINTKINEAMKDIFPYQPEKQLKPPIQLSGFRINQKQLSSEVSLVIKHTVQMYKDMQYSEGDLLKKIEQSPYVYLIKAVSGDEYIATLIVTLDRDIQQYKALKTLYIGFNDVSQLQMLMMETTKFVEKYQNGFEMHFPFFQNTNDEPTRMLLATLQENLTKMKQPKCIVAQKQIYSNIAQVRFIFKRQNKNINYYPNRFPVSLHFKLSLIHSQKKLFLQRSKIDKSYNNKISYDFLLSQILRKIYDSATMNILKQKSLSEYRFKQILNNMIQLQKGTEKLLGEMNPLKFIETSNISEFNNQQSKRKEQYPFFQLSDTFKTGNKIQSVSFSFAFRLPYQLTKSLIRKNNQMYYKISIRQQLQTKLGKQTIFYKIPLEDQRIDKTNKQKDLPSKKYMYLFDAEQYISLNYSELTTYLIECIIAGPNPVNKVLINQLWLPMLRYPQQFQERQELYLSTHRLPDLHQLKQELFVGEFFEWFCDMQIENGIKYQDFQEEQDIKGKIMFKRPLGLAIVAEDGDKTFILYGRIFANK